MKKKIIILTLCFTVILSSINLKKSYAFDLVISPLVVVGVVSSAVACGLVLKNNDDIHNLTKMFYEHYKNSWDLTEGIIKGGIVYGKDKVTTFSSECLELFKNFYDDYFVLDSSVPSVIANVGGLPVYSVNTSSSYSRPYGVRFNTKSLYSDGAIMKSFKMGDILMEYSSSKYLSPDTYYNWNFPSKYKYYVGSTYSSIEFSQRNIKATNFGKDVWFFITSYPYDSQNMNYYRFCYSYYSESTKDYRISIIGEVNIFDYESKAGIGSIHSTDFDGTYGWNDKISGGVYVPGNLGELIDTVPGANLVENPSISPSLDGVVSIPNVNDLSLDLGIDDTVTLPSDTLIDTPTDAPTDAPVLDFPSFGDSLDFSLFELTGITEKFPFSLPWDLRKLIKSFDVEKKAPIFKVPIVTETITVDLTDFEEWANITRWFITISFSLGLIFISTKMKG